MTITQQVANFIYKEHLLEPHQTVVAGVSGGPDSLCLLDCLHALGYPVVVGHLDHQLRPGSGDEAKYVEKIADSYGVKAIIGQENVRALCGGGKSLEEAARLARYRFLVHVAKTHRISVIATGHTADDQAETVLMHFLRGAGPSGLRGMLPATKMDTWRGIPDAIGMTLVRPLLNLTRDETQAYCNARGLSPVVDHSNLDTTFLRNRLRHELLPELETYNPGIRNVLIRMGQVMAGEASLLEGLVAKAWDTIVNEVGDEALTIEIAPFLSQSISVQRALVRTVIDRMRPTLRDVGFETVERALDFIEEGARGKRLPLTGGLEIMRLQDEVLISFPGAAIAFPHLPQLTSSKERTLEIPGKLQLAQGWSLFVDEKRLPQSDRDDFVYSETAMKASFDAMSIHGPLILRPPRQGDRIRPLGMQGRMKVADLFINEQIPQPARANWPVVACDDLILWVVGLRMCHEARLKPESEVALVLHLRSSQEEVP
jgi:tRNA(Ile)-lysidine synthase